MADELDDQEKTGTGLTEDAAFGVTPDMEAPGVDNEIGDVDEEEVDFIEDHTVGRAMLGATLALGQLIAHYPARDVTFILDGDAAMRLLSMFHRRLEGGLADALLPVPSLASNGWVVLDLAEPLAMTWIPGLPTPERRTAVDPVTV